MTPLSQQILQDHQVRKTRKQKAQFIRLLQEHFPQLQVQEGGFPKSRNLILGDVSSAKLLLTAHYDTCAVLPLPNVVTPKSPLLSVLYSLLLVVPMLLILLLLNYPVTLITDSFWVHYFFNLVACIGFLALMMAGPANKHTANDNTSGVITLLELAQSLPEEVRSKVAFVFFDNEEIGLVGSYYFRKVYKKQLNSQLLMNFDCVSDGDHILVAVSKSAQAHRNALESAFSDTGAKHILLEKAEKIYYPSDQLGFPKHIAVAALKKSKLFGYYMDRIHTNRDTQFDEANIVLLTNAVTDLLNAPDFQ